MMLEARFPPGILLDGSKTVEGLSRPECVITEYGPFGCVLCSAAVDVSEIHQTLSRKIKLDLPRQSGRVVKEGESMAIWLSPRSWLILCPLDNELELITSINAAFPDRIVLASAFSDYLCWFSLNGKEAEDKLRHGGFISFTERGLAVGHAKRTLIAGIQVIIHREFTATWTVGIERSYAPYFINWLRCICE